MHESLQQLSEALGSESILVVEDELLVQRMLASVLKPFGDRVHFAHDGVHGLEQFAARPFAVALCDLHMPAMNGIDLCAAVRRDYPESALLATSGFLSPENASRLTELNVDFLPKPFRATQLYEALAKAIEGQRMTEDQA